MSGEQTTALNMANLADMIESIVVKVLDGSTFDKRLATWAVNNPQISSHLSYKRDYNENGSNNVFGAVERFGNSLYSIGKSLNAYYNQPDRITQLPKAPVAAAGASNLMNFGANIAGIAGVFSAYKNEDPLGGAMAGAQFGPVGAAIGFLAGLFGKPKEIDKWDRPKFTDAKQAYEKLFSVDRGERDAYFLPDSFYFRTGWNGGRQLIVKIGNEQFDEHIRESLTNSYSSQLQRGLVF